MARSRPAGPPNGQRPLRLKYGVAMETHEYGDDPWTNGKSSGVLQRPQAKSSCLAEEAPIKQDETGDKFAIPTPIAQSCWKVISPDGHEQLCYEPIPGFEHLWSGPTPLQGTPCFAASPKSPVSPLSQPTEPPMPGQTSDRPRAQQNSRKRTQSARRKSCSQPVSQAAGYEEENGQYNKDVKITTEQSYTFYIGDIAELKKFFRRRLDELTMKPLRPIVTAWIKQLEPKRLSNYGPYHKRFPREVPPECTPPWWPSDVRYEEPSHLDKAVDIMLQHRLIDMEKRKGSWVAKLRQAAQYAVETTPPDQFSSSKGSGFSERMQSRALAEILPNLFETAQLFEDHLAYHGHYEGSGIPDPGRGKRVTWQPLTRPARKPVTPRKRPRRNRTGPGSRSEIDTDVSVDETEMDDSTFSSYLPDEPLVPEQTDELNNSGPTETQQQGLASTHEAEAVSLQTCPYNPTTTAAVSYGQPVYEFPLGDRMDLDVKTATPTPLHNHIQANSSHVVPYSTSHLGYNQPAVESRQETCPFLSTAQSTFTANSASVYHPFSTLDTHFSHSVENMAFHNDTCYPHGHEAYAPSCANLLNLFHGTPDSTTINCQVKTSPY